MDNLATDEGFATGDPDLVGTQPKKRRTQAIKFIEREHFLPWKERHVLRHAIHASKVASIGHRNANVVYLPAKGINHVRLVLPDATKKLLRLLVFVSIFVGVLIPPSLWRYRRS